MRSPLLVALATFVLTAFRPAFGANPDVRSVSLRADQQVFLKKHCTECHDADKQKGKVRLDDIPFTFKDVQTAERWQKVLNVLNSGEMPPEEKERPDAPSKAAFLEALSETMVAARKTLSDTGGAITMRRLNKREYERTIESLLGVKLTANELPNDGGGSALDTHGKSLFFSSDQFEQYLSLARRALDLAIASGPPPKTRTVRTEVELEANHRITDILRGYQMGGYRAHKMWKAAKDRPTSDFGIIDEGELKFRMTVWERNTAPMIDYLTRPETKTGALLTLSEPNGQVALTIPDDMPSGKYRIRARAGSLPGADSSRCFLEIGQRGKSLNDAMNLMDCLRVNGTYDQPEIIETEIFLPTVSNPLKEEIGPETKKRIWLGDRVIAFRERQPNNGEYASNKHRKALEETGFGAEPNLWIDWVEWEGPLLPQWPTAAHTDIFFEGDATEKNEAYARRILERFAHKAFRGKPVKPSYLDRLVAHFREQQASGAGFEEAVKTPLAIILASPSFLYLAENADPSGTKRSLEGHELASRLSYFLWSTPPDAALLQDASEGRLRDRKTLEAHLARMLDDPRHQGFIHGFTHQWLHLERLDFFQFNHRLHPTFDDSVKNAAREEVFETVAHVLHDNLPAAQLIKSEFIVINDLLADFYGISGVKGRRFQRVPVPEGMPRGGLPGMAAILAMGSDGERTSPVERGAWVLRKLLHQPPPPAPANVPQLSRHAGKLLPARELLAAHMEEPQCSQCHRKIDPIGFGLENFNAVGLWRTKEYTEIAAGNSVRKTMDHPIDTRGTLPDGSSFEGFYGLRDELLKHERAFVRGLTEQLIAYALGRPFGFSDEALAETVIEQSCTSGPATLRDLVRHLVLHPAFQTK